MLDIRKDYYTNGNIELEYYYLNGELITDDLKITVMKGLKK